MLQAWCTTSYPGSLLGTSQVGVLRKLLIIIKRSKVLSEGPSSERNVTTLTNDLRQKET